MLRRSRFAATASTCTVMLVLAAPAGAEPPTLLSVGQSTGRITATFQVPSSAVEDSVEVSTQPDVGPDGSFVAVLHEEPLIDDARWTSERRFRPGIYYVHVSSNDFLCEACPRREWSAVLSVEVLPILPLAGLYAGPVGDFGARIKFRLGPNAARITDVTLTYDLECSGGTIRRRHGFEAIPLQNGTFATRGTLRFRGGARESILFTGKLVPPRRASGRFRSILRIPRIGRCVPFRQSSKGLLWTASRR